LKKNEVRKTKTFNKNVLVLVGGTTIAQISVMLASPIITRVYTPDDFGILGVYVSLMSFFVIISTLKYELAIPLPKHDKEAINILSVSVLFTLLTSFILLLVFAFFGNEISETLKIPELSKYIWTLPLGVFVVSLYNIFSYWSIRKKEFKTLSVTKISQSISSVFSQILLGVLSFGVFGLIFGQIIGQSFGIIKLYKSFIKNNFNFKKITPKTMKKEAVKYSNFPKFSVVSTIMNTLSAQAPPLLFAILFNPAVAGFYVLSQRIVTTPMNIIGNSISNVFHANAVIAMRDHKIAELGLNVFEKLVKTGMVPLLFLLLISQELFSLVFGENWLKAGIYVQYLIPWLFLVFIGSPLSNIVFVLDKQKQNLFFHFLLFLIRFIALYLGYLYSDDLLAVLLFGSFSFFVWLGFVIWVLKVMEINILDWIKILLKEIIFVCPLVLIILCAKHLINSYIITEILREIMIIGITAILGIYVFFKRIIPIWKN
jgi:O-antigen/teichoic acid export membrane protein